MKSLSLVIFWAFLASCLFAQETVTVKKVKSTDKVVSVDVMKSGENERTIKIVTDEDGDEKVIEWTDNGEIPDDVKRQLEEEGIDIAILDGGEGKEMFIEVEADGDEREVRKEVIMIKKGDGDEVMEFEWDGEGEMPEEMRELMEEHDIDIESVHEGHGKGNRVMKMRKHKDKMRSLRHKTMKDGRHKNMEHKKEYKIVTIDEDGNEEVKSWVEKGDDGDHDDGYVIRTGPEGRGGNSFFFSSDEPKMANAYMGAQIESAEDGGAKILDLMKDSPADKAGLQKGDVITRVNGARARTMDDLLGILKYFDPEDKVELVVLRDGKEKKIDLTLGMRPDAYR